MNGSDWESKDDENNFTSVTSLVRGNSGSNVEVYVHVVGGDFLRGVGSQLYANL